MEKITIYAFEQYATSTHSQKSTETKIGNQTAQTASNNTTKHEMKQKEEKKKSKKTNKRGLENPLRNHFENRNK